MRRRKSKQKNRSVASVLYCGFLGKVRFLALRSDVETVSPRLVFVIEKMIDESLCYKNPALVSDGFKIFLNLVRFLTETDRYAITNPINDLL